jgi:tetrathionate reductase subunit B
MSAAGPPKTAQLQSALEGSAAAPAASVGAHPIDRGRRQILAWGAAMAGVTIAPGITLFDLAHGRPPAEGATNKVRWGMLVDVNACASDCDACVVACDKENGLSGAKTATSAQWIRKIELTAPSGETRSLPMMCQHCADPPCVDVCPTGASFKRADGIVLVDRHTCIGCRYCMMACPYKARSFVHEPLTEQKTDVPRGKGCVESCTLCVHRIDRDQIPACVEACAATGHKALLFGNLNDPSSAISQRIAAVATEQVRADLRLDTGVRYQGL